MKLKQNISFIDKNWLKLYAITLKDFNRKPKIGTKTEVEAEKVDNQLT